MGGWFPFFVDIEGRKALVAGAGQVASRRASVLADFGCQIRVVAPDGSRQMERLLREGKVRWERREVEAGDLGPDVDFVIAATDSPSVNDEIASLCRANHIPVNHAGDQRQCDFFFPGIARRGDLVAGVTASGRDHKEVKRLVALLRSQLEGGEWG